MNLRLAILLTSAATAIAQEALDRGGYGTEHLTEDKLPPVGQSTDDAKLLEMRKSSKFQGFVDGDSSPKTWNLNEHSEFITYDGKTTLVPKGAVIHVPEALRAHVVTGPQGEFVQWMEFLVTYRSIITTLEITLDEASGKTPIPPERAEEIRKNDRIVVTVLNHSPITCLIQAPSTSEATPATP